MAAQTLLLEFVLNTPTAFLSTVNPALNPTLLLSGLALAATWITQCESLTAEIKVMPKSVL